MYNDYPILPLFSVPNAVLDLRERVREIGERAVYRHYKQPDSTLLGAYIIPRLKEINSILDRDCFEISEHGPRAFQLAEECEAYLEIADQKLLAALAESNDEI